MKPFCAVLAQDSVGVSSFSVVGQLCPVFVGPSGTFLVYWQLHLHILLSVCKDGEKLTSGWKLLF